MKSLNYYTRRADYVDLNGFWRIAVVLLIAFLFTGINAQAQKKEPVPGKGGTVGIKVYTNGTTSERGFEVDAHFQSGIIPAFQGFWVGTNPAYVPSITTYGDDWSGTNGVLLKSGSTYVEGETADKQTVWKVDGNSGNKSTRPELDMFAGTSNKNDDFIGSGQSPWSVKAADGGPQKNDITNVYLHTREDKNGDKWLFFAFETRSTDGTSYGDIEFNQAGVTLTAPNGGNGSVVGNGTLGGRTEDDFILSVDFSGGGTNPKIAARKVQSDGTWTEAMNVDAYAYLTVNIKDVLAVVPGAGFNGDGSASNTTYAFQLIEGAINLTDADLEPTGCTPDATITFKTRSSDSFTAELKDLSVVPFAITPPATVVVSADESVCPTEEASFTATVSGPGATGAGVQWFKCTVTVPDDPSTPNINEEEISCSSTPIVDAIGDNYEISVNVAGDQSTLKILSVTAGDVGAYKAFLPEPACGAPSDYAKLILNTVDKPFVVLIEATICGTATTGSLKVCNPIVGAKYTLIQVLVADDPNTAEDEEELNIIATEDEYSGSDDLVYPGLKAGYGFELTINLNGCTATTTCLDNDDSSEGKDGPTDYIRETCPAPANPIMGSSSVIDASSVNEVYSIDRVEDELKDEKITAYPVPFSRNATVEFRMANTERYEINLYDMKGNLIKQLKSGRAKAGELQQIEVDGQKLPEGMYLVRVVTKDGAQTVKLLKKE